MRIPGGIELLLADNPSFMTLTGTNTWVVPIEPVSRGNAQGVVVIDPGPSLPDHIARIREAGRIEAIFLTHHHADHSEIAAALAEEFRAPVFAHRPELATNGVGVSEGERHQFGRLSFDVLHTPGHTHDSICLLLDTGLGHGPVLFTGDTLLGGSTTMISRPDGSLAEYFETLDRLAQFTGVPGLPGHGMVIDDVAGWAMEVRMRRENRVALVLEEWRTSVSDRPEADQAQRVTAIAAAVYGGDDGVVPEYFERMVRAHLRYLSSRGMTGAEEF